MSERTKRARVVTEDIRRARALRRSGTEAERRLWRELRSHRLGGYKSRRQHSTGPYILDFYCHEAMLAVELDGGQHDEPGRTGADRERETWLGRQGVRVVRFWNNEVLQDTEAVLEAIWRELCPHPDPLPGGEGAPARAHQVWPGHDAED